MKVYGWIFVRPRRWFFSNMIFNCYPQWFPKKHEFFGWQMPNIHWWILYKTVFKFFKWLHYDGWRPFCDWTGGYRRTYPLIARFIHRIGATTAGYAIGGFECYHCASEEGCQVELSEDRTGEYFNVEGSSQYGTQDGTHYEFWGITTCPKCGYKSEFRDGS